MNETVAQQLQRISFTQSDIGLINDLSGYIEEQASFPTGNYVADAVLEGIKAKSALIQRILKGGIIENE